MQQLSVLGDRGRRGGPVSADHILRLVSAAAEAQVQLPEEAGIPRRKGVVVRGEGEEEKVEGEEGEKWH